MSAYKIRFFSALVSVISLSAIGCGPASGGSSAALSSQAATPPTPSQSGSTSSSDSTTATAPAVIARASNAANLKVCAGKSVVPGADVSNYDPNTNWTTFQHAGNGFAYVKATEGLNFTSSLFSTDWAGIRKAGVLRGGYHFFHPGDDPLQQAEFYLKTIGTWDIQDLPPMLDWEVSDGVAVKTQIANAKLWLQAVEAATGRVPVIYADPSFINELGNPQGLEHYPLFIANYGATCPSVPPPWSTWTFWQKNLGAVAGVKTNPADIDEFNGTLAQLVAL